MCLPRQSDCLRDCHICFTKQISRQIEMYKLKLL